MSTDAAVRAAERSGDTQALVRALIRAGRGQEVLKVRGLVVGDEVERFRYFDFKGEPVVRETGRRGRIGAVDSAPERPQPGDQGLLGALDEKPGKFVYVIFADGAGRLGLNGVGLPCLVDTLALVETSENLPPMTLVRTCHRHYAGYLPGQAPWREDNLCEQCGRPGNAPRVWEEVAGARV